MANLAKYLSKIAINIHVHSDKRDFFIDGTLVKWAKGDTKAKGFEYAESYCVIKISEKKTE